MVHALHKIHRLLAHDGVLIDLQPVGEPRLLELCHAGRVTRLGYVGHRLNFAQQRQAQAALAETIAAGLFVLERRETFPFLYHADSFSIFQQWLSEEFKNAVLDEAAVRRARSLVAGAGESREVIMREEIVIARLRPAHS